MVFLLVLQGFVNKEDVVRKLRDDGILAKKSTSSSNKKTDGKKSESDAVHSVVIKDDDGKDKFRIGRPGIERYCQAWYPSLKALEDGKTDFEQSSHSPLTFKGHTHACARIYRNRTYDDCGLETCLLVQLVKMKGEAEVWMDKSLRNSACC